MLRKNIKIDLQLMLIIVMLVITLAAFAFGVISYPVGWIILVLLLVFKIRESANRERD